MALDKYTRAAGASYAALALTFGIAISLNVLGVFLWARVDMTENQRYSLSDSSRDLVSNLDSELTITAYITEDMPPPALDLYLRDLLSEYESAAGGDLRVVFINPDEDEEKEAAIEDGVRFQDVQTLENDSIQVQRGMRGLVFKYLNQEEVLNIVQRDSSGLEYEITTTIMQMTQDKIKIGIVGGHGSPSMSQELQALAQWLPLYEVQEVGLGTEVPSDISALLIIAPSEAFPEPELHILNQFVMRGGSLGVFGGSLSVGLDQQSMQQGEIQVTAVDSGLNQLLNAWGVELSDSLVLDQRCRTEQVPVLTNQGMPALLRMPWLAWPIAQLDQAQQENPVTFRVDAAQLMFPAAVQRAAEVPAGVEFTSLIRSSETSALLEIGETGENVHPNSLRQFPSGAENGPQNLLVAIEGQLPSAFPTTGVSTEQGGEGETASTVDAPAQSTGEARLLVMGTGLPFLFVPPRERARLCTCSVAALESSSSSGATP